MTRRALLLALLLAGCSVERQPPPALDTGAAGFRRVDADAAAARVNAAWPALFGDPTLVRLVDAALERNPDVLAMNARVDRARAAVLESDASLFPTIGMTAGYSHNRVSGSVDDALPKRMLRTWSAGVAANYEVDPWGRLRGATAVSRADALAAQADAAAARVRIAAAVAVDYLTLRYVEADIAALARSVELRRTALQLVRRRVAAGAASDLDALRASTELETAQAESADSEKLRQNLTDAIAVLLSRPAPSFTLPRASAAIRAPAVPVGLPAAVLAQRPDVDAAQRRLEAAALQVGVAKTAWLPNLTLTANGGFASRNLADFLDRNSSLWGLAASLATTLFDGGRRDAALLSARADYTIAEANYRGVAYAALRDVQDALNEIAAQQARIRAFDSAALTAQQAAQLSRRRYTLGYVDYFEVVNADRDALGIERDLIHARQALAVATVNLVVALGGGWGGAAQAAARP